MERELTYILFLDKNSIRNLKNIKKIVYRGNSCSSKFCIVFHKNISNLIIIYVGDEDIKKIRQDVITFLEEDPQIRDIISRAWISFHNVPNESSVFFIRVFNIFLTNTKENNEIICDISYLSNITLKYHVITICEIIDEIYRSSAHIVDSYVINSILYSYRITLHHPTHDSAIDILLHVLKLLMNIIKDDRHHVHILNMLYDKFEEFKYYLDSGLMFHALNIYRGLHDVVTSILADINDRDLRFLVENIIKKLIVFEKFDNVYSCVKCFISYVSSFDRYVLPLCKFFIMYIVLKLLSECAYYGYIDSRVLDLDNVDAIFSNYDLLRKVIDIFNRGELKSLLHNVHVWEMCGISRAYCRFIYYREVSEFGNVLCRGRINIEEARRLLFSCLDLVESSCYEYCERVRELFKIRR
ncbi:MAG: hypothetical protein GXO10_05345 [Crenarchaeota archaeon]|nr:hypothetical protein [Thermoproteota archaeon]